MFDHINKGSIKVTRQADEKALAKKVIIDWFVFSFTRELFT